MYVCFEINEELLQLNLIQKLKQVQAKSCFQKHRVRKANLLTQHVARVDCYVPANNGSPPGWWCDYQDVGSLQPDQHALVCLAWIFVSQEE